jgi:hypothetical protein
MTRILFASEASLEAEQMDIHQVTSALPLNDNNNCKVTVK